MQILFVCTGNTCRSPMAEGFARELSSYRGPLARAIRWSSGGIAAVPGMSADPAAINVMLIEGIDISDHQTQAVTMQLIRDADLILTMTASQKQEIASQYPFVESRVFALKEYAYQAAASAGEAGMQDRSDNPLVREIMLMDESRPLSRWNREDSTTPDLDIMDPIGGSLETYESCAREIKAAVESLLDTIAPEQK